MIRKIYSYVDSILILSTGYLSINVILLSKLNKMVPQVKKAGAKTNPEEDLVIQRLHLYCNMKLVTFSIGDDSDLNMISLVFVQPYSQSPLTLY